jgi:hypothetical protein
MGIIQGVLKEELENSLRMLKRYRQEYKALPKGSLVRKKVKNKEYDYLACRENGKFALKYMGQLSDKKKSEYMEAKKKRLEYRKLIADLKDQVKFIKRALHERK